MAKRVLCTCSPSAEALACVLAASGHTPAAPARAPALAVGSGARPSSAEPRSAHGVLLQYVLRVRASGRPGSLAALLPRAASLRRATWDLRAGGGGRSALCCRPAARPRRLRRVRPFPHEGQLVPLVMMSAKTAKLSLLPCSSARARLDYRRRALCAHRAQGLLPQAEKRGPIGSFTASAGERRLLPASSRDGRAAASTGVEMGAHDGAGRAARRSSRPAVGCVSTGCDRLRLAVCCKSGSEMQQQASGGRGDRGGARASGVIGGRRCRAVNPRRSP